MADETKDWKLKLRYGILKTELKHFTVIADGMVGELTHGFQCPSGRAFMSMKTWASDEAESQDMIRVIGHNIGFEVDGEVYVYDTEPEEPPTEKPHGYDISFKPYEREASESQ